MEMQEIISLVNSAGFPICMSFILIWYLNKNDQRYDSQIQQMTEAVTNNTKVIEELIHTINGKKN